MCDSPNNLVAYTCLIVPAENDIAGTCGIFIKETCLIKYLKSSLSDYRSDPYSWKYVGHMNSQGRLIASDLPILWKEAKLCEPLMAGMTFEFYL